MGSETSEELKIFVEAMKKHLAKENVEVSEETLKKALKEARQQYMDTCQQCVAGWRW
jgi:predicted DNA-binding protein (UPF0251 family)